MPIGPLLEQELHRIFRETPHPYLVLTPDFFIVGANTAYLARTYSDWSEIERRYVFEVFPDNPELFDADGVQNLGASLGFVTEQREPHSMPIQRYDVRGRDRLFVERYWKPANYPIFDEQGRIVHILHHVESVTKVLPAEPRKDSDLNRAAPVAQAEYCAERARSCQSEQARMFWLELEGSYRELEIFRSSIAADRWMRRKGFWSSQ